MLLVFYITTPKERTAADTRSLPRRDTAARFPWFPPHHSHTNRQYLPPITPYPPSLATALRFHLTVKYCPCLERNPIDWKVFLLLIEGGPLVFLCFPWVSLVFHGFPCLEVSPPQNKSTPPTPSIKPETFLPIVPRGTPVQSRISRPCS